MKAFHYALKYRYPVKEVPHCPDCNSTHWHIGRNDVECARCGLPLPTESSKTGGGTFLIRRSKTAMKNSCYVS